MSPLLAMIRIGRFFRKPVFFFLPFVLFLMPFFSAVAQSIQLKDLHIVLQANEQAKAVRAAATVLSEEIQKRTGLVVPISGKWPAAGTVILLQTKSEQRVSGLVLTDQPALIQKPESFRILHEKQANRNLVIIEGYDDRGVLFGAGQLLRIIGYQRGAVSIPADLALSSSPSKPMRGHQLGYRNTANSYDAWDVAQYDQYIRELAIFGTNSIESIPIFDEEKSPHFKMAPDEMNAQISRICDRYDLDYWIWVPAQFDLKDSVKRNHYLERIDKICRFSVRLNGVFFPGGDPGDNPPEAVWPLLADIAVILNKYHPEARVWLSLQGYTPAQSQTVYGYIRDQKPSWLGGLVTGPSSPPVEESRAALPANYKLRYYPDLTHNMRSDWPVPYWDPYFNFTMGRESVNPRPMHYAALYHFLEPYMDGFISYSDGIHDDVNKITWTRLAWNSNESVADILREYANFFFSSKLKEDAADAILALETNWQGAAETNGSIQTTWMAWKQMELKHPELSSNWRWQLYLLRANYDAYARKRGVYEAHLEEKANSVLREAAVLGPAKAMQRAQDILEQAALNQVDTMLRNKIINLCEALFHSIGLQTSVKKYQASGEERGAVLDFIDFPLNDRWWMEDRFKAIASLPEADQVQALDTIANWENPGPGGYYDDIGNVARSPHVLKGEPFTTDPLMRKEDNPNFDWWNNGFSRQRHSWMSSMRWPLAVEYNGLDSGVNYTVRITGYRDCRPKANGQLLEHTIYGKGVGEIKEFPVSASLIKGGRLVITFEDINEDNINWRQQSRVTEIWLIKK